MTTLHVDSVNGTPSGDGSASSPAMTYAQIKNSIASGDTVELYPGDYREEIASAARNVIMKAHDADDTPRLLGSDMAGGFVPYSDNKFANASFETAGSPFGSWTADQTGSSTVTAETTDHYHGTRGAKIYYSGVQAEPASVAQAGITLTAGDTVRVAAYHKEPGNTALKLCVRIQAMFGGAWYHLSATTGQWLASATEPFDDHELPHRNIYTADSIEFDVTNPAGTEYKVTFHGLDKDATDPAGTYYLDAVSMGVAESCEENLLDDPSFESYPSNWSTLEAGDLEVNRTIHAFHGSTAVEIKLGGVSDDGGVYQASITLDASTTYRFGACAHSFVPQSGAGECKVAIQIVHQDTLNYWDGSSWTATQSDASEAYSREYAWQTGEFTTPSGAGQDYTFYIHTSGTRVSAERLHIDYAFLTKKAQATEVQQAYFTSSDGSPEQVYATGIIDGETVEYLQLFEETDSTAITNKHPFPMRWVYDDSADVLYVNVPGDAGGIAFECAVRENCIDLAGYSSQHISNMDVYFTTGDGVAMGYGTLERPDALTLMNVDTYYTGKIGIAAGYHPADPSAGFSATTEWPTDNYRTPSNITIGNCGINYYNRANAGFIDPASGGSYRVPNGGIRIFAGTDALMQRGNEIEDVLIYGCHIQTNGSLENLGGFRNGITVTVGNNVRIYDNWLQGIQDHGIVVVGQSVDYTTGPWERTDIGDVRYYEIKQNRVHLSGDDCVWTWGVLYPNCKIVDNLLYDTGDNGIDVNESFAVEIYNNTISNCKNEMICFRDLKTVPTSCGYVYNNIFHLWGSEWNPSSLNDSTMRRGVAIGFEQVNATYTSHLVSVIDHNTYYQDPGNTETVDYPFHWYTSSGVTRQGWTEWQAAGFDLHGQIAKNPQLDTSNYTLGARSPCRNKGRDLTTLRTTTGPLADAGVHFDYGNAITVGLDPTSNWTSSVQTISQYTYGLKGKWDVGCFVYPGGGGTVYKGVTLKKPTLWHLPGSVAPVLRATVTNDPEVDAVEIYRADSATADDDDWELVDVIGRPTTISLPYVETVDGAKDYEDTWYYRARQVSATGDAVSAWSNVVTSDEPTFIFEIRQSEALIRDIQLRVDTEESEEGLTWEEAMEVTLEAHLAIREQLGRHFNSVDLASIWAAPPAEVVQMIRADVAMALHRRKDIDDEVRQARVDTLRRDRDRAYSALVRDGVVTLADGQELDIASWRMSSG